VNEDFIIDVLNILPVSLLFIQESFQVLESTVVHGIREIQVRRLNLCLRLSFVYRISVQVWWVGSVGVTSRDSNKVKVRLFSYLYIYIYPCIQV